MVHELPLERATVHGHFSRDLAPVLSVDPGDSVVFSSLNAGWRWESDREHFDARDPELDAGHALNGPIEVRGARAGQTLVVGIDEVTPGGLGRHLRRRQRRTCGRSATATPPTSAGRVSRSRRSSA